jgi:hypothetical protein
MHCSPRKAAAGAMIMPKRGGKPSRTRFKMGGGNFPDLTGDGKVTQKDILKGRGVSGFGYGGTHKKKK